MNIDRMKWNWPTLAESDTINNRLSENPRIEIPITRRIGPDVGGLTLVIMKHQPIWISVHNPRAVEGGRDVELQLPFEIIRFSKIKD